MASGAQFINSIMIDTDRYDNLTTDTNYRAMALDWVNRVVKDISTMQDGFHWRWLEKSSTFDTVASQLTYDLPSDIDGYKVFSVRQATTDIKLFLRTQDWVDKHYPDPTAISGNPTEYTLWANSIRLLPMPFSVIEMSMRYIKTITTLTDAAGSTTDIPAKWDDVVISGALVKAYKFDKRLPESMQAQKDYLLGIERMKADNESLIDLIKVAEGHRYQEMPVRYASPAGQ